MDQIEPCHEHSLDDPGEVPFWMRGAISVGDLYRLRKELAESKAQIIRLQADVQLLITRQWIPTTQRLPEANGKYLTLDTNKSPDIRLFLLTTPFYWEATGIVAWMPIPELPETIEGAQPCNS